MCYFEQPKGHSIVMQGMENIKEHKSDYGPFDSWLKSLYSILDKKDDLLFTPSQEITADISITEHAVS